MQRLDKFLEVLFLRGATGLVLQTGSAAYLQTAQGTTQTVMQRTLSTAHIIAAGAELMPPYRAQAFSGTEAEEFELVGPSGRVQGRFVAVGDSVRADMLS